MEQYCPLCRGIHFADEHEGFYAGPPPKPAPKQLSVGLITREQEKSIMEAQNIALGNSGNLDVETIKGIPIAFIDAANGILGAFSNGTPLPPAAVSQVAPLMKIIASGMNSSALTDKEKAILTPALALPQAVQFKAWTPGAPITSNELLVLWAIYRSTPMYPGASKGQMRTPGEYIAALSTACTTVLAKISAALSACEAAAKANSQVISLLAKTRSDLVAAQARFGKICGVVSTIKAGVDAAEVAYQKAILPPPVAQEVAAQTAATSTSVAQTAAAPAAPADDGGMCVIS